MKLKPDNKTGMILCNRILKHELRPKDKEFVDSIMRRIIKEPLFTPTAKQIQWLKDIWNRYENHPHSPR